MTLPTSQLWQEEVRRWRINATAKEVYALGVDRSYALGAFWPTNAQLGESVGRSERTASTAVGVLVALRLFKFEWLDYSDLLPNGDRVVNPRGRRLLRPLDPFEAKRLLEEFGPIERPTKSTRPTKKATKKAKRKSKVEENFHLRKSRTNTENPPLVASESSPVHAEVEENFQGKGSSLLGPSSSSDLSDSVGDAVVDAVFSKPASNPCAPSPEAQVLQDAIAADYAYLDDRRLDVADDDRLKVFYALTFFRARGIKHDLHRRYTEGADALHNFGEVTNTPRLAAVFESALDRDRVIEPNDFQKGRDAAKGGALYHDTVPF